MTRDDDATAVSRTRVWCVGLLTSLDRTTFRISADHYLRVERLLDQIGPHVSTDRLRTLIGPIVVTSAIQQRRFEEAYEEYLAQVAPEPGGILVADTVVPQNASPDISAIPPVVVRVKTPVVERTKRTRVVMITALALAASALFITPTALKKWEARRTAIDSAKVIPPKSGSTDDTLPIASGGVAGAPNTKPVGEMERLRPEPFFAEPAPVAPSGWKLFGWFAVVAPLLGGLVLFWRGRRQGKLIAERTAAAGPPIGFKIMVPVPTRGPFGADEVRRVARETRRRQRIPSMVLSVERSVAATVDSLGFPTLVFEFTTRPPEYVVLIQRATPFDHEASLYESLIDRLDAEGAIVFRFNYAVDPRMCYAKDQREHIWLEDLFHTHPDARLVVVGDGQGLIDPDTGRPVDWISMFCGWEDRAFLTTVVPGEWNRREVMIAEQFVLLPATLAGLASLADFFDAGTKPNLRDLRSRLGTPSAPTVDSMVTIAELRSYFDNAAGFQWLCACAVYPELRWDLTLHLANIPALRAEALTEENLLRLVALPWFATGVFPDQLRLALLDELARMDNPDSSSIENEARQAVNTILTTGVTTTVGTVADERRVHNTLINDLYLHRADPRKTRSIFAKLRATSPGHVLARDATVVRLASQFRVSRLAHVLPDQLRQTFFVGGESVLGVRAGAWALPALLLAAVGFAATQNGRISDIDSANIQLSRFEIEPEVVVVEDGDSVQMVARGILQSADSTVFGVRWTAPATDVRFDSTVTAKGEFTSSAWLTSNTTTSTWGDSLDIPGAVKIRVQSNVGRNFAQSLLLRTKRNTGKPALPEIMLRPRVVAVGSALEASNAIVTALGPTLNQTLSYFACTGSGAPQFGTSVSLDSPGWSAIKVIERGAMIFIPVYATRTLDSLDRVLIEPIMWETDSAAAFGIAAKANALARDTTKILEIRAWSDSNRLQKSGQLSAARDAELRLAAKGVRPSSIRVIPNAMNAVDQCVVQLGMSPTMRAWLHRHVYFSVVSAATVPTGDSSRASRRIFASSYSGVWNDEGAGYAFDLQLRPGIDSQVAATLRWTVTNPGRLAILQSRVGSTRSRTGKGVFHESSRSLDIEVTSEEDSLPSGLIEYQLTFDSTFERFSGKTRKARGEWKGLISGERGKLDGWRVDDVCRLKRPVADLALSLEEGLSLQVPLAGRASNVVAMAPWTNADAKIAVIDQNGMITARAPGTTSMRFVCGAATNTIQVTVASSSAPRDARAAFAGFSTLISFDQGKTELSRSSQTLLNSWADRMKKHPEVLIGITGYTTAVGAEANDSKLAMARADQVRAYLVSRGVPDSQLTARSAEEKKPICAQATPECRAVTRRVELSILGDRRPYQSK